MIEVKNLTKRYGSHTAVDDLSFTVNEGKVYGFLGPNGAGKSTTMNIMTGCLAATEGDVIINGHNILEEPEKAKRTIGYLPEIPPLYPDMTVREYLTFAAELKKVPRKEVKMAVTRVMQELSIMDVADRLIRHLSKGYKQRVGFAQALIGDPETLILDEPTVGLDPKQIMEIRELIKSLGRRHTVILSSHILAEVSEICDTVLIMSHGRLVAQGSPENLADAAAGQVQVTITSPAEMTELQSVLGGIENVKNVILADDEDSIVTARLTYSGADDPRKEIIMALSAAGCPYYSVDVNRASLEDIFLELTDEEESEDEEESKDAEESEERDFSEETVKDAAADAAQEENMPEEALHEPGRTDSPEESVKETGSTDNLEESTKEAGSIDSREENVEENGPSDSQEETVTKTEADKTQEETVPEEAVIPSAIDDDPEVNN